MTNNLKSNLRAGDQIIAIADARYPKHIDPEQKYSQRSGDIVMVNNPRGVGSVGGTGITGFAHNGRSCLGLGCSLKDGTYRRATPEDPGYLATREQWHSVNLAEIKRLRASLWDTRADFWLAVVVATVFAIGAMVGAV